MDFENMDLKWQNMLAGIQAQVPYVRQSPEAIYEQVRTRLALQKAPSRIYLVGCGDSWYCGMATRLAFEKWSGVPTEALQALEFSRYYCDFGPADALVVGISNSGRVARTVEALARAGAYGMNTVAGTSAHDSRIAKAANVTLDLAYAERRFAPGTSSYMASMVIEYCIALYIAEVAGNMDAGQVTAKLAEISALADGMQKTIDENMELFEMLASQAKLTDKFIFLGGGPNYGTAFFSMAKMIEAARVNATGQELEEWAHEQYFVTGKDTYTFVIAPPGAGVSRAREQLWAANEMGSTTLAICDAQDKATASLARIAVPIHGGSTEELSPLVYCIPAELFGFHFAVSKNLTMLGFDDAHVKEVNFKQIFESEVIN